MPERSSVAQVSQIGVETVAGTAVTPTRRLGSLNIVPAVTAEVDFFRPEGLKFPTVQVENKEWAAISGSGQPTYEEVIIPLSGAMGAATVTQLMDGGTATGVYQWVFSPNPTAADAPKTFTLQRGQDTVAVETMAHLLFTSFGLDINRGGISMSCDGFANVVTEGTALTAGLTVPAALNPITPGSVCVYMATSQAALTSAGVSDPTKRLTRVLAANPSISDRYQPAWFVNCAIPGFTTYVENPDGAGGTFALTAEADAVGMGLLNNLRAGDTLFLRVEAFGAVQYNAGVQPNLKLQFRWDMACKVGAPDAFSDEDGIYAIPWTLTPVYDPTWGKAMEVTVRNKIASL